MKSQDRETIIHFVEHVSRKMNKPHENTVIQFSSLFGDNQCSITRLQNNSIEILIFNKIKHNILSFIFQPVEICKFIMKVSIKQYERIFLMNEMKHRIKLKRNLLKIFQRGFRKNQDNFKNSVLGTIVYTRYNNKVYYILDVLFNINLMDTIETKDELISYIEG